MNSPYCRNSTTNVWSRAQTSQFDYSDGDETEAGLLDIISKAADVTTASSELAGAIVDWPTEYHLSAARHNLLRPFKIGQGDRVLELGCGCGAISRFLGESGAIVTAVEGSLRRAVIAAARCRGLANVSIYCDNLITFASEDKFDFVTLIGVLEYAPRFVEGCDPVTMVLNHARSFLKPGGTLILAIENQLGLKYLNGCNEDHLGIPYYGINDLYRDREPVTFGRHALSNRLLAAGFSEQTFFYPFPDYKLPCVILSGHALSDERLNIADLLVHQSGNTRPETWQRAFAENLAWRAVIRNRMLPDLANSFLILARAGGSVPRQTGWLAKTYSSGSRRACFRTETTILPDDSGTLAVRKRRLFQDADASRDAWLRHAVADSPYHSGKLLVGEVHRAMAREDGIDALAACFSPWLRHLLDHALSDTGGAARLPKAFVDCIPSNLVLPPGGAPIYIDAEWEADEAIPLPWVVTRGIVNSLGGCLKNGALRELTYREGVLHIARLNGIDLDEADLDIAAGLEARLVAQCYTRAPDTPPGKLLSRPVSGYYRLSNEWLRRELDRVKRTVSWRITAPLRVISNLLRKIAVLLSR